MDNIWKWEGVKFVSCKVEPFPPTKSCYKILHVIYYSHTPDTESNSKKNVGEFCEFDQATYYTLLYDASDTLTLLYATITIKEGKMKDEICMFLYPLQSSKMVRR